MGKVEEILTRLSPGKTWEKRADGWWSEAPNMDVEKMARVMAESKARLVTMTACGPSNGEFRIIYHWDLENQILNMATMTHQGCLPSIAMIHPVSDWTEREIYDCFAVRFTGRQLQPLLLSPGDSPGFLLDRSAAEQKEREKK
jgi:NADH:ubiquinone oxidoreductase subunit C